jgi:hypothetical protein
VQKANTYEKDVKAEKSKEERNAHQQDLKDMLQRFKREIKGAQRNGSTSMHA